MPRPTVAFLGPAIANVGGTETWHKLLLPRLDRERLDVLGYLATDPRWHDSATAKACRALGIHVGAGYHHCATVGYRADVLVCWGVANPSQFCGDKGRRKARVVMVAHGDGASPFTLSVMAASQGRADHFAAVSPGAVQAFPPGSRVRMILNGLDAPRAVRTRAEVRAEFGFGDRPVLGYVGRLSPEKGTLKAIEVFARLPEVWTMVVAGDAMGDGGLEFHRDCQRLAADLGVADRVRWLGPRQDVGDLYAGLDVCICPSLSEGFGYTMAEAMLAGVPLVSSPVGVCAGADAGDRAELVHPFDSHEDWAGAVQRAISGAKAAAAKTWAAGHLGVDRFAREWTEYLLEVAG